jgi:hypothetical protein
LQKPPFGGFCLFHTVQQPDIPTPRAFWLVTELSGTVTVVTESGSQVVLDLASDTEVFAQGRAVSGLTRLVAKVGAQVEIEFNAETKAASKIEF